jgi:hypothetical protein
MSNECEDQAEIEELKHWKISSRRSSAAKKSLAKSVKAASAVVTFTASSNCGEPEQRGV